MIHPDTELQYINNQIGYGVVAKKLIPAGTITWVLDKLDLELTPADFQRMDEVYQSILDTYTYRNRKGNYILCWDLGKYVNHSFRPNCVSTAYDFELAVSDIHPGEQLTNDYGFLNIETPFHPINEGTDRKVVYPDDLLRYHQKWDEMIQKVFGKIIDTEQPLRKFLANEVWAKIESIISGKEQLDSILNNFFDDQGGSLR